MMFDNSTIRIVETGYPSVSTNKNRMLCAMINKTLSIILLSIICFYPGIASANPVNSGIILAQFKMLDKGIEKTREFIAVSNNKEIIQRFNRCCNTQERIVDLIKDEKFDNLTLDRIIETQKEVRNIRRLIEQEIFIKKKLEEIKKNLKEKEQMIASSNNKKAEELFDNASKNMLLARKAIEDNNITFANQYMDTSIRLLQIAVSFANGREKIDDEIEYLKYRLKKAERIAQISKKEEVISMVNEAKELVEKIIRLMITYRNEDYEKVSEQINLATKLITRAIRSSGINIYDSMRLDREQLSDILNETNKISVRNNKNISESIMQRWVIQLNEINKIIVQCNNSKAKKLMNKAMKMAEKAEKAISSNDCESGMKYINSSYNLVEAALIALIESNAATKFQSSLSQ